MGLVLVTPPTAEPVTLAEAKTFCRVDHDWENELLTSLVSAARTAAETETGRQLVSATWRWSADNWPESGEVILPRPTLQTVSAVQYYDPDGVLQSVDTDEYFTSTAGVRGRVVFASGFSWPSLQDDRPDRVSITFTSGYGSPADVPAGLKTAIGLLVAHWYENRELSGKPPASWKYLVQNYNAGKI